MKRSAPLQRRKGLQSRWSVTPARRACRRVVQERDGNVCAYPGCLLTEALELHEVKSRARGGDPEDPGNCKLLCHEHNVWVEDNPIEARRIGLAIRSWETVSLDKPGRIR